jgi:hypothetical protein
MLMHLAVMLCLMAGMLGSAAKELSELEQVGAIALGRMLRESPLEFQIVQESLD